MSASLADPAPSTGRQVRASDDPARRRVGLQRKLSVGSADDPLEREADEVAAHVVEALSFPPIDWTGSTRISRSTTDAAAAAVGTAGGDIGGGLESRIRRSTGGTPLDDHVRDRMERAFGGDFGDVRLHIDSPLPAEVAADAFTLGSRIHLAPGRYDPSSRDGQHLLAHELTHVVQQGGAGPRAVSRTIGERVTATSRTPTIRRRRSAITTKEVVSIVKGIPQLAQRLDAVVREQTVQARIEETLRTYKAHIAGKKGEDVDVFDAMMLSTALTSVARIFADELNDPSVATALMPLLVSTFETEVGTKLKSTKRSTGTAGRARVMALTKALSKGDPVTQYMHREIRKEVAAEQIRTMAAADPSLTPIKVFELMAERWQAAMATYRDSQLKETVKDPAGSFNRAEAHGEYSPYFFERTFGSAGPTWVSGGAGAAEHLSLTADADQQLQALRAEVQHPTAKTAVTPRAGVTERQERHLAGLEAAEAAMPSVDTDFLTLFADRYLLTAAAARALLADVKQFIRTDMKLTITVDLAKWFGSDAAPKVPNPDFAPAAGRRETTQLSDLFGKSGAAGSIEHLPTWDDTGLGASARGPSYLRFRHWKDQLMTGLQDMTGTEMASFGAGNVTWETVRGGDAGYGVNYYGDLHFVLDRQKFGTRIVYTASDHGEPRRDALLALHDLCSAGRGRTWLREVKDLAMLDNVVNAVRTKAPLYGAGLKLEFQVFGGINIRDDVTEVVLGPNHTDAALQRVTAFYQGKGGVAVSRLGAAPPGGIHGGDGGVSGEGVGEFLRVYLAQGSALDANQKGHVSTVQGSTLGSFEQQLLIGAYTLANAVTSTAHQLVGHLEAGDERVLKTAVEKAEKMRNAAGKNVDGALAAPVDVALRIAKLAVANVAKPARANRTQQLRPAPRQRQQPQVAVNAGNGGGNT